MTIEATTLEMMVNICAGLVREGCTFESKYHQGVWIITLTGGF